MKEVALLKSCMDRNHKIQITHPNYEETNLTHELSIRVASQSM